MTCRFLLLPFAILVSVSGCSPPEPSGGVNGKPARAPAAAARQDGDVRVRPPLPSRRSGIVAPPRDALLDGLRWLARHQSPDGRWSSDGFGAACGKADGAAGCDGAGQAGFDVGVTGLALLSFLGAGFNHVSDIRYDGIRFGDVVKKGQQWLVRQQGADGCIGGKETPKYVLQHAIAALALCEAYGLIGSETLKEPAARAIGFIVQAQNPGAGWRYAARSGDSDTFVTGWCVMALKSAQLASIDLPPVALEGAKAWLDRVTDADGRAGYDKPGSDPVVLPGRNERFANHDTMSAIAMLLRVFMDRSLQDERIKLGTILLLRDLPAWEEDRIDYCYWYFGEMAIFQYDGTYGPGKCFRAWRDALWPILWAHQAQAKDRCDFGSWDPVDRWGRVGGRVYATALCTMMLECYGHENVFKGPDK